MPTQLAKGVLTGTYELDLKSGTILFLDTRGLQTPSDEWNHLRSWAKIDGQAGVVSITNGLPTAVAATAIFTQADVGKSFDAFANGGAVSVTGIILAVSKDGKTVTCNTNFAATASGINFIWGTDDTANVQLWVSAGLGVLRYTGNGPGFGFCFVKGTVTFPLAGAANQTRCRISGDSGGFWISAAIGSNPFLVLDNCAGNNCYVQGIQFSGSPGATGRVIQWATANEASTEFLIRDVHTTMLSDGGDYHFFIQANAGNIEHCHVNANNNVGNKGVALTAVISQASIQDSTIIGRVYTNAQQMNIVNCGTGPLRLANNSAADGSGTAQQVNVVRVNGGYTYSSSAGATDFPCIQSVAATAAGEGAAGGVFPNVMIDGTYFITGAGANGTSQTAITGNTAASQGGISVAAKGACFTQSASSIATTIVLFNSTGGAGSFRCIGCAANILNAVTTAKIFTVTAGTADMVVDDFMPTGVAAVWQHPTVSTSSSAQQNLPATGVATRNAFPTAWDIIIQNNGATMTAVTISQDNSTYTTLFNDATGITDHGFRSFRWPPGAYMKFTYVTAQPQYILLPCP